MSDSRSKFVVLRKQLTFFPLFWCAGLLARGAVALLRESGEPLKAPRSHRVLDALRCIPGGGGGGGGGGGALEYLGGRIRSLSKLKSTPKALISGQKSTLILIKTLTFSTK